VPFFLEGIELNYSSRFDLRPFLYPPFWKSWSFKKIDRELEKLEKNAKK
jgi:NAD+ synthase (glutamine-hydrolysing)